METAQHELFFEMERAHWWFAARRRILCHLARCVLPPSKDHVVVDVKAFNPGSSIAFSVRIINPLEEPFVPMLLGGIRFHADTMEIRRVDRDLDRLE